MLALPSPLSSFVLPSLARSRSRPAPCWSADDAVALPLWPHLIRPTVAKLQEDIS